MSRDTQMQWLAKDLQELIPLVTEAVVALDKPGRRSLRRKLDQAFNSAIHSYNAALNADRWGQDWSGCISYERVIPVRWGGRGSKAKEPVHSLIVNDAGIKPSARPAPRLSLVVNDGGDHAA